MASIPLKELLARFILHQGYLRNDKTVRPEAFMPYPYLDLSVTRHGDLNEHQLWQIGKAIADSIPKRLYARADVAAVVFGEQKLRVLPAPTPENPNHLNVDGWPSNKFAQKSIAQEIAARITNTVIF